MYKPADDAFPFEPANKGFISPAFTPVLLILEGIRGSLHGANPNRHNGDCDLDCDCDCDCKCKVIGAARRIRSAVRLSEGQQKKRKEIMRTRRLNHRAWKDTYTFGGRLLNT
jgi:hypothetical protein